MGAKSAKPICLVLGLRGQIRTKVMRRWLHAANWTDSILNCGFDLLGRDLPINLVREGNIRDAEC